MFVLRLTRHPGTSGGAKLAARKKKSKDALRNPPSFDTSMLNDGRANHDVSIFLSEKKYWLSRMGEENKKLQALIEVISMAVPISL